MDTLTPPSPCPVCGHILDAATGATDDAITPNPGDVSICIECGEILIFAGDLRVRLPTPKEKLDVSNDRVVMSAQLFIRGRKK